jgi:hypothetical protein
MGKNVLFLGLALLLIFGGVSAASTTPASE